MEWAEERRRDIRGKYKYKYNTKIPVKPKWLNKIQPK